jgi:hypothetical protein
MIIIITRRHTMSVVYAVLAVSAQILWIAIVIAQCWVIYKVAKDYPEQMSWIFRLDSSCIVQGFVAGLLFPFRCLWWTFTKKGRYNLIGQLEYHEIIVADVRAGSL